MTPIDEPVRSVFDCNVLLQAMANPNGPAGACLNGVRSGRVHLILSRPVLAELVEVAARPVLARKLAVSPARTDAFVDELLAISTMLDSVPSNYQHPLDPKDSMYVDLAISADARLITSRDRHLLALRNPTNPISNDFIPRFPSIEVLTPVELLQRLRR